MRREARDNIVIAASAVCVGSFVIGLAIFAANIGWWVATAEWDTSIKPLIVAFSSLFVIAGVVAGILMPKD